MPHRPVSTLLLLCTILSGPVVVPSAQAEPPNVLVILTDDQGCGDYSGFGTADIRTPNLDRLAREGLTFRNFYANSTVCSPTRAALLTGCYPDRVGVPGVIREEAPLDSWGWLSPAAMLLPEALKKAGYHSAIVGKWHLGTTAPNLPTRRGFDHFHGFLGDMMDDYFTHLRRGHNYMRRDEEVIQPQGHATDLFTEWACEYVLDRARSGQPFFLYLAYNAPHDPLQPTPAWLDKVRQRQPGLPEKRARLLGLIEHMDDGVGRVLATLDRAGLTTNTLVIFTSDNGGLLSALGNNGPYRGGKGEMYEGGLRVPGIARWPGVIRPGTTTDRIVLSMDVFPTVCEAAGAPLASGIDGRSFLAALRNPGETGAERELYFVRREGGPGFGGKTIEALRKGPWKVLQNTPFTGMELYNIQSDPYERTNLWETVPQIRRDMAAALRRHIQNGGSTPWQRPAR